MDVPWRLREDLAVPAPHHITLGHCPASHTGHQETCLITATADPTHSGRPTSRSYPDSDRGFMNAPLIHVHLKSQRVHERTSSPWKNLPGPHLRWRALLNVVSMSMITARVDAHGFNKNTNCKMIDRAQGRERGSLKQV